MKKLIAYGMMPDKAKGILTSKMFYSYLNNIKFNEDLLLGNGQKKAEYDLVTFYSVKSNFAIRKMSIPHPVPYLVLCNEIANNWEQIEAKLGETPDYYSRSRVRPKTNNKNKRLLSMQSYDMDSSEEKDLAARLSMGKEYIVKTDIANFFPSIYTHSIPWAVIGRGNSKEEYRSGKSKKGWHNLLDIKSRRMQSNETIGIPIGPDTSNIISELILSDIDKYFGENDVEYIRFIDDITAYFSTNEDAQKFINTLSYKLSEYRLSLNHKKTSIGHLPEYTNDYWVNEINSTILLIPIDKQITNKDKNRVSSFIDIALRIQQEYPNGFALRYAIQVLRKKIYIEDDILRYVITRIGTICYHYPSIFDLWIYLILRNRKKSESSKDIIEEILRSCEDSFIEKRLSDKVSWLLILRLKFLKSGLKEEVIEKIFWGLTSKIRFYIL